MQTFNPFFIIILDIACPSCHLMYFQRITIETDCRDVTTCNAMFKRLIRLTSPQKGHSRYPKYFPEYIPIFHIPAFSYSNITSSLSSAPSSASPSSHCSLLSTMNCSTNASPTKFSCAVYFTPGTGVKVPGLEIG